MFYCIFGRIEALLEENYFIFLFQILRSGFRSGPGRSRFLKTRSRLVSDSVSPFKIWVGRSVFRTGTGDRGITNVKYLFGTEILKNSNDPNR